MCTDNNNNNNIYVSHHDDDDFRVNDVGDDRIADGVDGTRCSCVEIEINRERVKRR